MWRQFLESLCHEHNSFVTLTYRDDCLPGDGCLVPDHATVFIRELRRQLYPVRIRYFLVGEYGETTRRPHYHLSLFGVSAYQGINNKRVDAAINDAWGMGYTSVYEFNHLTAQYVSGYVVKKLKDRKDGFEPAVPEFARMSNRPGIGANAMGVVAKALLDTHSDWESGDVPRVLRIGQRSIPLGRYLLARLRREVGFSEAYIKEVRDRTSYEKSIEMQTLLNASDPTATFKASYLNDIEGKLNQVEARARLFKKRDTLK